MQTILRCRCTGVVFSSRYSFECLHGNLNHFNAVWYPVDLYFKTFPCFIEVAMRDTCIIYWLTRSVAVVYKSWFPAHTKVVLYKLFFYSLYSPYCRWQYERRFSCGVWSQIGYFVNDLKHHPVSHTFCNITFILVMVVRATICGPTQGTENYVVWCMYVIYSHHAYVASQSWNLLQRRIQHRLWIYRQ